jgi:hypothetical protein
VLQLWDFMLQMLIHILFLQVKRLFYFFLFLINKHSLYKTNILRLLGQIENKMKDNE